MPSSLTKSFRGIISSHLCNSKRRAFEYTHFTDEATEAWGTEVLCRAICPELSFSGGTLDGEATPL